MSLELNKVMLVGNLTRDPETSFIGNGTALAKLGMALNRRWKDKSGEQQEETTFVDVTAWAKTAEFCGKYLQKGSRIFIEGRLEFQQWQTKEGEKRSKLSVTADRVQFADSKPQAGQNASQRPAAQPAQQTHRFLPTEPAQQAPAQPAQQEAADDLPF